MFIFRLIFRRFWWIRTLMALKFRGLLASRVMQIFNKSNRRNDLHNNNSYCRYIKKNFRTGFYLNLIDLCPTEWGIKENCTYLPSIEENRSDLIQLKTVKVKRTNSNKILNVRFGKNLSTPKPIIIILITTFPSL